MIVTYYVSLFLQFPLCIYQLLRSKRKTEFMELLENCMNRVVIDMSESNCFGRKFHNHDL